MGSNYELKKANIKNSKCCYFDNIVNIANFDFDGVLIVSNHMKMFWLITFHAKLWLVQNHFMLALIKYMDLLEFIMELDI